MLKAYNYKLEKNPFGETITPEEEKNHDTISTFFSMCEFTAMDNILSDQYTSQALIDLANLNKFTLKYASDNKTQGIIFSGEYSSKNDGIYFSSPFISYDDVTKNIAELKKQQQEKMNLSLLSNSKKIHQSTIDELDKMLLILKQHEEIYKNLVSNFKEEWKSCFIKKMQEAGFKINIEGEFNDYYDDYYNKSIENCELGVNTGGIIKEDCIYKISSDKYLFHSIIDYLCSEGNADAGIPLLKKYFNLNEKSSKAQTTSYRKLTVTNEDIKKAADKFKEKKMAVRTSAVASTLRAPVEASAVLMPFRQSAVPVNVVKPPSSMPKAVLVGTGGRRTKRKKPRMRQSAKKMRPNRSKKQNTKMNKRRGTHKRH
jgi:hypothetical protein